jgi:signal peptidase I
MKGFFRELAITLGLALLIFLVYHAIAQTSVVEGSSMQPGLENGQRLVVLKAAYFIAPPQRGDIVIAHPPVDPGKEYVKRLIGLPGDKVQVKNGLVYVNGVALHEPYLKSPPTYTMEPVIVPPDHYFVMGDNRNNSYDSHFGWTVTRSEIVGEVWLRYWPFSGWGLIHGYPLDQELQKAGLSTSK